VAQQFAALVSQLAASRLLTADEAASLQPTITVKVMDERRDRSVPLGVQAPETGGASIVAR
jgi:uncharacterized protein HemY